VIADFRRLARHRAGAVINEKVRAYFRAGCKSMPVRLCAHSVMMRGIKATFFAYHSCANRCTAIVSTNGYATMIFFATQRGRVAVVAASMSVCSNSRMCGSLQKKIQRQRVREPRRSFLAISSGCDIQALVNFVLQMREPPCP